MRELLIDYIISIGEQIDKLKAERDASGFVDTAYVILDTKIKVLDEVYCELADIIGK